MAFNIYQEVTDRIIAEMEKGIIPWQKPWDGAAEGAYNRVTKKPYSFVNQLLLIHDDAYLTFKQAKALGGNVKKGAKSEMVVFWKWNIKEVEQPDGTKKVERWPVLKYYNVFWIGDCEGIEPLTAEPRNNDPIDAAEQILRGYINRDDAPKYYDSDPSNRAYYRPSTDEVVVPMINQYEAVEEYYSTAFHELTHSTGHSSRLDRGLMKHACFGSEEYSKEELVAEIGAAMLVKKAGIETTKSFRNSTAYIQNWLSALKNDNRLIIQAAGKAEKAVQFILGEKGEPEA